MLGKDHDVDQKRTGFIAVAMMMTIVLALSSIPFNAQATSTKEQLEEEIEDRDQTQAEIDNTEKEKEELEAQHQQLTSELSGLTNQLTAVSNNLADLEQRIINKKAEITQKEIELDEAVRVRNEQYEAMKRRIKFMYEKRDYALLEALLTANSFADFLNNNAYFEQMVDYDEKKLAEFKQIEADVSAMKEGLIAEKEELDVLAAETEAEQNRYTGLVNQTSGRISVNADMIAQAEQEMLAYEQELKEQNERIEQLQKQLEEERRLSELAASMAWRNISDVTFAEGDRKLLANLIYCEAGNQPYEGQVAVGAVVMNRVLSPVFPNTILEVIYQPRQFSPVASQRLALALSNDLATQACYNAADAAMTGASPVGNYLFFRTPIPELEGRGISIGGHVFY